MVLSIIGLVLSERGRVLATEPSGSGEAREGKRATSLRQPNTRGKLRGQRGETPL